MAKETQTTSEISSEQEPFLVLVGERIRAARRRAKLKQSDVAEAIGTRQSYIVGVEAGETNITLRTLARVAAALEVDPLALLVGTDPEASAAEATAKQVGALLETATRDNERVAELLRQAHAMVSGTTDKTRSDLPPVPR